MTPVERDAASLESMLAPLRRVIIAFSGGVDSSVVAAAAARSELESALAVTADSPSVPRWQLELACKIAGDIGIEHRVIATREGERDDYRRNDKRRCFYCKQTLYSAIELIADAFPGASVVSGTNADDLGDYRPGIQAGKQNRVVTPLADLGMDKARVRALARHFALANHDLPASPCLASRIAYGTEVTPERLRRIEIAEDWLRERGFQELRVRLHPDELARIEVPRDQIEKLLALNEDNTLTRELERIGFNFVTIDLAGFRSGSMNRVLVTLGELDLTDSREAGTDEAAR